MDDVILCKYNETFALVWKRNAECGYAEFMCLIRKRTKDRSMKAKTVTFLQQGRHTSDSLIPSICRILTQRYKTFLYKNDGDIRGGIMTLAKVSPLNKFMKTKIVYYNTILILNK
jgi:hypothetical protein